MTTDTTELLRRWITAKGSVCNGFQRREHTVTTSELRAYPTGPHGMFQAYCGACALRRGLPPVASLPDTPERTPF